MMQMTMRQVWGVAVTEMRLQWRRRLLPGTLLLLIGVLAAVVAAQRGTLLAAGLRPADVPAGMRTSMLLTLLPAAAMAVLLLTLPLLLAEAVPRDAVAGVGDLLASVPLSRRAYLAGKLLGAWCLIGGLCAAAALAGWLLARLLLGPLALWPYVRAWLTGLAPFGLFVGSLSLLLAARQRSRRRAAGVAGLLLLVFVVGFALVRDAQGWAAAFTPGAWLLVVNRVFLSETAVSLAESGLPGIFPVVQPAFVGRTLLAAVVELGVVWWGAGVDGGRG